MNTLQMKLPETTNTPIEAAPETVRCVLTPIPPSGDRAGRSREMRFVGQDTNGLWTELVA